MLLAYRAFGGGRMNHNWNHGALVLLTLLIGCASPLEAEDSEQRYDDISNGGPDLVHRGVAAMIVETPSGLREVCTATLISPTVLVTAGHCVYLTMHYDFGPPVWISFDDRFDPATSPLI